ncbi:polysaccharide biosynthesis protein [Micromonospora sp. KC213]|uniref:polysaccharide biosynthesis protein n=1 Tax=Micromonospora sp. KC213 TaxID=2530378 RepID=UPI001A9F669B|nr:polysaccharide biosynthesis protein [Micromonospora sp. KC213]
MTETTARSRAGGLGTAGAAVAGAGMVTNGLAYLVPMLGARHLPAEELSVLATVLALVAIAGVPGVGLQLAVAVHRVRSPGASTGRVTLVTTAITAGTLVTAAPLMVSTLHLSIHLVTVVVAATVAVVLAGRWLGELQGDERFVRLAVGMGLLALGRYAGTIGGLVLGAGATGALLAGLASVYVALPVIAWIARPGGPRAAARASGGDATVAMPIRRVLSASTAVLAMLVVSYADLILARLLLPAAESGAYSVGTVLTKGALWAPQVVTVLALPRMARRDGRTRSVALAVVGGCGVVLVIASALAGGLAFRLAGGESYAPLGGHAPFFAATGALYALVFVQINAQIAAGARWPSLPLWVATGGLAVAAVLLVPRTFPGIMWASLAAAFIAVVLTFLAAARNGSVEARHEGHPAAAEKSVGSQRLVG